MIIQQFFGFSSPWSSYSHIHIIRLSALAFPCHHNPSVGGRQECLQTQQQRAENPHSPIQLESMAQEQHSPTQHPLHSTRCTLEEEKTQMPKEQPAADDNEPRNPQDVIGCGSSTTNRHRLLSTYYSLWLFISMKLTATPATTSLSHC